MTNLVWVRDASSGVGCERLGGDDRTHFETLEEAMLMPIWSVRVIAMLHPVCACEFCATMAEYIIHVAHTLPTLPCVTRGELDKEEYTNACGTRSSNYT